MMVSFVLSGCNLFPRDVTDYLNKPVATLEYKDGKKVPVTTEQFINAFNNYGSGLIQNGTSYEDALEQTLDVLISRVVLINEAELQIKLEKLDMQKIYNDTYIALLSNLSTYEDKVRTDWNMPKPTGTDDPAAEVVVFKGFAATAEVVLEDGQYKIKLTEKKDDSEVANKFSSIQELIETFIEFANPKTDDKAARVTKEAYRRLISVLKANEENMNLSKDSKEILTRFTEKTYTNIRENKLIEKLEDEYKSDKAYSTISVQQVLNRYKSLLLESKFKYENNSSGYTTAMLDAFKDVNYYINSDFFEVNHILIKFNEEQKSIYKDIANDAYTTPGEAERLLTQLTEGVSGAERDAEGKIIDGEPVHATDVYNTLKRELDNANSNEEKVQIFRNYLYRFNQDTGNVNAEYNYVIGVDDSRMVESFNKASRELNESGEFGAISNLVVSEHGVHIIFYAGKPANLFTVNESSSFTLEESDIEVLASKKLNCFDNKTWFDKIFADLSNDSYSIFENMNMNVLKSKIKIIKHSDVYKKL